MLNLPSVRIRINAGRQLETREQMIRDTNAFLTAALAGHARTPRIPRRRMDHGGFAGLMRRPGGRAMADRIWQRLLDLI